MANSVDNCLFVIPCKSGYGLPAWKSESVHAEVKAAIRREIIDCPDHTGLAEGDYLQVMVSFESRWSPPLGTYVEFSRNHPQWRLEFTWSSWESNCRGLGWMENGEGEYFEQCAFRPDDKSSLHELPSNQPLNNVRRCGSRGNNRQRRLPDTQQQHE